MKLKIGTMYVTETLLRPSLNCQSEKRAWSPDAEGIGEVHHREGIGLTELADMFPDGDSAGRWFRNIRSGRTRQSTKFSPRLMDASRRRASSVQTIYHPEPDCTDRLNGRKQAFSVRTGTALERSKFHVVASESSRCYLDDDAVLERRVRAMKLHRDIECHPEHGFVHAASNRGALGLYRNMLSYPPAW